MKDRNILITGVSGFIGSRLAMKLVDEGANVTGLVNNLNKLPIQMFDKMNIVVGNICDYNTLCETISFYEIDTIFHFAANSIVRSSAKDPMSTYRVNVMGTVTLLEAARNVGRCKSIIVASSDKCYGDHEILPYIEDFALQPRNTYDTSKACMDMISRSYAWNYDMPVIVTRCSNVYGPGDMNLSRIVPNTIKKILDGKKPQVYNDVKDMEREFIYIDDVISAYTLLSECNGGKGEAFNIGGTGETKILDLVGKISKEMGSKEDDVEIVKRDNTFKEIRRQYIDATKIELLTTWKPSTDLDSGIKKSVEWYSDFFLRGIYK